MTGLIICEKPNVAKKIAEALGKPKKKSHNSVPYYELERNGESIVVASAVGHLYTLQEKTKTKFGDYPVYDINWVPASTLDEKKYIQKYIDALKKVSKDANKFYVATDWDIEGELIGYHALNFSCGQKNAHRLRFSSLTKKEILKAYENPNEIDFGLVDAGDSRHKIDWYFGINVSRALMQAVSSVKRWKTLSTGRVQGPALAFLVDKELEIRNFVPTPYWVLEALLDNDLIAVHELEKFWDEEQANKAYEKVKGQKQATVSDVKKSMKTIPPNPPFDLGALQREAHNMFRFSPKKTQEVAQKLYEKGYCSYPRTSSQKLPDDKAYMDEVLKNLSKNKNYKPYIETILNENRKPISGKNDDPAHPAVHAVDVPKEKLPDDELKLYELIARRTIALYWDNAKREYSKINLDINGETFKLSGSRTVEEGWHEIYYYTKFDEVELPELKKNDVINVNNINFEAKETKPPKRYTMASIIKELEKRKLGTKATRADILEKLTKRGYVIEDGSLTVTDLGIGVTETLRKYCPEIVEETLTRDLEDKLELIQDKKIKKEEVIQETKDKLTKILGEFRLKEKEIGTELVDKLDSTNRSLQIIGKCKCGGDMIIIRTKGKKRFVGCSNYPDCEVTFPLPQKGRIKVLNEVCEKCQNPVIGLDRIKICVNPDCSTRISEEDKKEIEKAEKEEKICPKCGNKLLIKKGPYGVFRGCENYPKCKYTEKLNGESNEKEIVGKCPKCGSDLYKRKGRFGEFIGCSNYPKCRHTEKIDKKKEDTPGETKAETKKEAKPKTTKKAAPKKTATKTTKTTAKKTATKKTTTKKATAKKTAEK
ncbi:DNA topoisomerase I [Methanococcus maripaludis]|uniref:DNA topoisomerase 1 n=1 Tax=Methanococcus maripaludis (strain DSM 14266 / JCM 13030 / NBRC 101832 / S2 / LL) TaxID=267377 RepID=Q6LYN4_METMP|nr:DNA topoisomerase I [Methanococcus maripaludis]CAF30512.1 DNA topoisomerase I [Methanococcus maripaludis S2]